LKDTEQGIKPRKVLSRNFTEYNHLLRGTNVICPYCAGLLKDPQFRHKSWIMTQDSIEWLSRKGVYERLLNPPKPPFAFYATRTGKKQGFIVLGPHVAFCRDYYPVSWDGVLLWVTLDTIRRYANILRELRVRGAKKSDLQFGCSPKLWHEAHDLCSLVEKHRGEPIWQLLSWASP